MSILQRLFYIPLFTQVPVDTISKTVTEAIDAGTIGVAVLLAVGLIILGVGMGLLIWRVIVPLLKQAIDMSGQVVSIIERTNTAITHSNETNTLQTAATNVQTGEIQKMGKNVEAMGGKMDFLSLNFSNYQTLTADTVANLLQEMVAFKGEIKGDIEAMLTSVGATKARVDEAVGNHQIMFKRLDQIIAQLTPPTPPPDKVIDLNGEKDTPDLKETA